MSKKLYLKCFGIMVIVLALVRCIFPSVAGSLNEPKAMGLATDTLTTDGIDSVALSTSGLAEKAVDKEKAEKDEQTTGKKSDDTQVGSQSTVLQSGLRNDDSYKHPIMGVYNYDKAFPDSNDVQHASAMALGVMAVKNREEAEARKSELVYMAASPYYHVDPLKSSIPYLVPKAAVLLNDIGRNFFDSLYVKRIPLHQFIVTSVLRSQEDIERLKLVNPNVSDNSCHLLGTTFDIGYNRYKTVQDPDGPKRRVVRDDTLKWVLSEVLRDLREEGRCYVKYEKKQGCFHITVR